MQLETLKSIIEVHDISGIKYMKLDDIEAFCKRSDSDIIDVEDYYYFLKATIEDELGVSDLKSRSREANVVRSRRVCSSIMKRSRFNGKKIASLTEIGGLLGQFDHTTVIHHDKTLCNYLETKGESIELVNRIIAKCKTYSESISVIDFQFKN